MYHRQTGRRRKTPPSRATITTVTGTSYVIAIDDVTHKPFSEAQFNQFARQFLNVLQRVSAKRHRPHARSVAALLVEEIPGDLWQQLEIRAAHDAAVHGRGSARVHDVILRLLRAYARFGLKPIESLRNDPAQRAPSGAEGS